MAFSVRANGILCAAAICVAAVRPASAQDGRNVLLVVNRASGVSEQIAARYAKVRSVPPDNIVRLTTTTEDQLDRSTYEREIERPIVNWIAQHSAQDQILYIVLTKGVPLRITGTAGMDGTVASVDSELTLLYRKALGLAVPAAGRFPNPYFLGDRQIEAAQPFSHRSSDIYLVTRLDGFTVDDVFRLIDRGVAPARDGQFLLDQRANLLGERSGDIWLASAAKELSRRGFADKVVLESTGEVLTHKKQVLGYYSWGSNDPAITTRRFDFEFVPGALAAMYVSTDGRTFTEPPQSWTIGSWSDTGSFYAATPQSLSGDLIREGATGVAGHVAEPYIDATVRPQILFPAYVAGFNLAESFYLAVPFLSWETVIVGDPLCAPFRTQKVSLDDVAPPLEPSTELPKFFSDREMAVMESRGLLPEAASLLVRGNARISRGDLTGAREPLERATALDPRLSTAHLTLASLYELAGDYDRAIDRYHLVLATTPDEPLSLNNLAYALAVRKGKPEDALPLAERAYKITNGNALMADTLGWVHHLLGHTAEAGRFIAEALAAAPLNTDILLHSAALRAEAGDRATAAAQLAKAIEIQPGLKDRPDVKKLSTDLVGAAK